MQKVPLEHEWLQNTQAELEAETQEMLQVSTRLNDNFVKALKLMWRQLFVIWAVVIILFIGSFFVVRELLVTSPQAGGKPTSITKSASPSEVAAVPQTPAAPPEAANPEWQMVQETLQQIRDAQLNKDINLLLAAYSPNFPGLKDKKAKILKTWDRYDYLDLRFTVANFSQQNADSIKAKVTWVLTLEDLQSQAKTNLLKKYTVYFAHKSGKWLIENLVPEQTPRLAGRIED